MANQIYTPTAAEVDARIARFDELTPMSTTDDLAWVPREAWEVFFALTYALIGQMDRDELLAKTRELLGKRLEVSSGEVNSIVCMIQSRWDVSLSRIFDEEE